MQPRSLTVAQFAHARFGIDINTNPDHQAKLGDILNIQYYRFQVEAILLYRLFGKQKRGEGHDNYKKAERVYNSIMKKIHDGYMFLYFENSLFAESSKHKHPLPPFNPWQFHTEKAKDYQGLHKLMHYLLRRLEQINLRKRDGRMQEELIIDGQRTGHWKDSGTIQEWLLKLCENKTICHEMLECFVCSCCLFAFACVLCVMFLGISLSFGAPEGSE